MKTKVDMPDVPQGATTEDNVKAWVDALPKIYETQQDFQSKELADQLAQLKEYLPQFTQQQYDIQRQFMPQYTRDQYNLSKELYPETVALQESLAKKARIGMAEGMPKWYEQKYSDYYKSMLGENAGSPIGAGYYSRGMLEQAKNWEDYYNNYYNNLGLSMTGRQPLQQPMAFTPSMGQTTNYMSGFTPMGVGQQMGQNYGNYMSGYGSMYNTAAGLAQNNPWMNLAGTLGGAAMGGMFGVGGIFNKNKGQIND